MRRSGVTPSALRTFAYNVGITKYDGVTDFAVLQHAIREELNKTSLRRLAVLRPIKVVLTNYPEGQTEELTAVNNPEEPAAGTRSIKFSREIYIENDDFMENPPPKYFRLRPGGEVRLNTGTSSGATRSSKIQPAKSWNCVVRRIWKAKAAVQLQIEKSKAPSIG